MTDRKDWQERKKKWQNPRAAVTTEDVWGEKHSFRHVTGHLATGTYMTGHLATGYDQLPSNGSPKQLFTWQQGGYLATSKYADWSLCNISMTLN